MAHRGDEHRAGSRWTLVPFPSVLSRPSAPSLSPCSDDTSSMRAPCFAQGLLTDGAYPILTWWPGHPTQAARVIFLKHSYFFPVWKPSLCLHFLPYPLQCLVYRRDSINSMLMTSDRLTLILGGEPSRSSPHCPSNHSNCSWLPHSDPLPLLPRFLPM